ncbi:MAG: potassium-transporting ATPase KdpC subunit [Gammaproteobacteria bacterium]|jgi:K+-transporting ATPase ATPase C chain|nr:potassium-transporting ATPase KdpC subunit [Gammaproteobacteria bacterium]
MNTRVNSIVRPAVTLFLIMTVLLGIVYPFAVTGLAQVLFHDQATGSLVMVNGQPMGSRIIGQSFSDPKYFWSRPSATAPQPYNAIASSGSNLGPLNPALTDAVASRIAALKAADPTNALAVPVDLVTASASGLDPDISIAAARYQAARVARARGLDPAAVRSLIDAHAHGKLFGLVGEPHVNVLELNLALDRLKSVSEAR